MNSLESMVKDHLKSRKVRRRHRFTSVVPHLATRCHIVIPRGDYDDFVQRKLLDAIDKEAVGLKCLGHRYKVGCFSRKEVAENGDVHLYWDLDKADWDFLSLYLGRGTLALVWTISVKYYRNAEQCEWTLNPAHVMKEEAMIDVIEPAVTYTFPVGLQGVKR